MKETSPQRQGVSKGDEQVKQINEEDIWTHDDGSEWVTLKDYKALEKQVEELEGVVEDDTVKFGKLEDEIIDLQKENAKLRNALEEFFKSYHLDGGEPSSLGRPSIKRAIKKLKSFLPNQEDVCTCDKCGTAMELSSGWTPTYSDPDNSSLAPNAEPYCPKCDKQENKDFLADKISEDNLLDVISKQEDVYECNRK